MKANELRQKSVEDLKKEYVELLREQFNLRVQKATSQLSQAHQLRHVRKNIARVLTILTEKAGTQS